ncbi:MAG: hypothetical protein LBB62_00450 [Proteiniphilum sp.]|nr:hypothetical protein [Proteiniphilum sp.]
MYYEGERYDSKEERYDLSDLNNELHTLHCIFEKDGSASMGQYGQTKALVGSSVSGNKIDG